jgi:hypothetical protein
MALTTTSGMTTVEDVSSTAPGSARSDELLRELATGAKARDLNDENPFDQVAQ